MRILFIVCDGRIQIEAEKNDRERSGCTRNQRERIHIHNKSHLTIYLLSLGSFIGARVYDDMWHKLQSHRESV